jgi:hypothetical protein
MARLRSARTPIVCSGRLSKNVDQREGGSALGMDVWGAFAVLLCGTLVCRCFSLLLGAVESDGMTGPNGLYSVDTPGFGI